jgi:hypothetical protein
MWLWSMEIDQYLQINLASGLSKRLLYLRRYVFSFLTYYPTYYMYIFDIFHVQLLLFVTLQSDQDPDPHWFESLDPDLHRDKKLESYPH